MDRKTRRINLKVPESLHYWIKAKSEESSVTLTEYINRVLIEHRKKCELLNEPKQF